MQRGRNGGGLVCVVDQVGAGGVQEQSIVYRHLLRFYFPPPFLRLFCFLCRRGRKRRLVLATTLVTVSE